MKKIPLNDLDTLFLFLSRNDFYTVEGVKYRYTKRDSEKCGWKYGRGVWCTCIYFTICKVCTRDWRRLSNRKGCW